jgi:hypothetical protein
MAAAATMGGFLIIAVVGHDIFHQLVHPSGKGRLSHWLAKGVWKAFRFAGHWRRSVMELAGPIAFVTVVLTWAVLLVVGWALIYWPRMPADFALSELSPGQASTFVSALYYSLVTLATLGYGDIVPEADWLRMLAVVQAAVGFVLWSAAITWLLSLYPALSRGRVAAYLIHEYVQTGLLQRGERSIRAQALLDLAGRLAAYRSDLEQLPIAYFFSDGEAPTRLPVVLPGLHRLAERLGTEADTGSLTAAAQTLQRSIATFAATLDQSFLRIKASSTEEVLAAYAEDHRLQPVPDPANNAGPSAGS